MSNRGVIASNVKQLFTAGFYRERSDPPLQRGSNDPHRFASISLRYLSSAVCQRMRASAEGLRVDFEANCD